MNPFEFNVNEPTSLDRINSYVGSYASPEAAATDTQENAPAGYDYLTNQYQRLTGDYFADPFQDAAKARDAALSSQIGAGRIGTGPALSVATGGGMGPRVLGAVAPTPIPPPEGTSGPPNLLPTSVVTHATAAAQAARETLKNPEYQLPADPTHPDFGSAQARRASLLGVRDIFDELQRRNPDATKLVDPTDPALEVDDKGRPVAGDVLNAQLFNDPKFSYLRSTDPEKANRIYQALFDRNLNQDVEAQVAANVGRTNTRKEILKDVTKTLFFDPVTQKPLLRTYKRDPITGDSVEGPPRELSAVEQNAIDQEGGFHSVFGFEPPKKANLTFDEEQLIRQRVQQLKDKNPNVPESALVLQARKELSARPSTAQPAPTGPGKVAGTLLGLEGVGRNVANTAIDQANILLSGSGITQSRTPLELLPPVEDINRGFSGLGSDIFDWMSDFGSKHVYGPSGDLLLR